MFSVLVLVPDKVQELNLNLLLVLLLVLDSVQELLPFLVLALV